MRILHVSDLHFRRSWFEWLAGQAERHDLVCISGDLLDGSPTAPKPLDEQVRWVLRWLANFPARLAVCTGNHDWWKADGTENDPLAEGRWLRRSRRNAVIVDGEATEIDGWNVACLPWRCANERPPDGRFIVVTHTPPWGTEVSSDAQTGIDHGDDGVRVLAEAARTRGLVLSGHVHRPRRWWSRVGRTLCLIPGVDNSSRVPSHVVIDTARESVVRWRCGELAGPVCLTPK
jgi:Icc-related predicted phosphoesterase